MYFIYFHTCHNSDSISMQLDETHSLSVDLVQCQLHQLVLTINLFRSQGPWQPDIGQATARSLDSAWISLMSSRVSSTGVINFCLLRRVSKNLGQRQSSFPETGIPMRDAVVTNNSLTSALKCQTKQKLSPSENDY